jgi:hypothetical protein
MMTYPSPALDGVDALLQNPLRWFLRQLSFYFVVSLVAAVAFIVGAGVYSYFLRETSVAPIVVPLPDKKPVPIEQPKLRSPSAEIPMAELRDRAIGAAIFFGNDQIGTVSEIVKDSHGQVVGLVITRSKRIPGNTPENVPELLTVGSNDIQFGIQGENLTGQIVNGSLLAGSSSH